MDENLFLERMGEIRSDIGWIKENIKTVCAVSKEHDKRIEKLEAFRSKAEFINYVGVVILLAMLLYVVNSLLSHL